MGARVGGRPRGGDDYPPLRIRGGRLRALRYASPVASAQVKSAILLAATVAGIRAEVREPHRSRDHTERMLRALGAEVRRAGRAVVLGRGGELRAPAGTVPGDPSAGAFFAAAAAALPGSDLVLEDVCLNPTRLGFFAALSRMGARVQRRRLRTWCGEPVGEIRVRPGRLRGIHVRAAQVPGMIDELPVLAVIAAAAGRGRTTIGGAAELRVKESDRISGIAEGLTALGAEVVERPDGWVLEGGRLRGGRVEARGDHRLAMAFRVAGTIASGPVRVGGASSMAVSHPSFDRDLRRLRKGRGR